MAIGLGLGLGLGNQRAATGGDRALVSYLFVDGNSLRMHLNGFSERYGDGTSLTLNWQNLLGGYQKVFYYDAIPVREENEGDLDYESRIAPIASLHDQLSEIDGFRVYEGDARKRRGRGLEQKKVDVMIAVDMLTHTIRKNMDKCGLLAGDLDFKPLLDALVNEGMYVTLHYPPRSTSRELRAAADARKPLTPTQTFSWLSPESQAHIGRFPTSARSPQPMVQDCRLIMECEGDHQQLRLWQEMTNDTVTLTWFEPHTNNYMHIMGSNWRLTNLLAKEEHDISIDTDLPEGYEQL